MADDLKKVGRLAMRQEGKYWNAYYALPGTMESAALLGSVAIAVVLGHPERMDAFVDMMCEAVADIIEMQTGLRPTFPHGPQPAPDHEGGHA